MAWVDFGLWGLSVGEANLKELGPLVEAGVAGVKLFWGYALRRDTRQLVYNLGDEPVENLLMPPNNGTVLRIFREIAEAGGLLAAHCEDRDILTDSESNLGHPITTYDDLLAARPDTAESLIDSCSTLRRGDVDVDGQAIRPVPAQRCDSARKRCRPDSGRPAPQARHPQPGPRGEAAGEPVERVFADGRTHCCRPSGRGRDAGRQAGG